MAQSGERGSGLTAVERSTVRGPGAGDEPHGPTGRPNNTSQ